MIQEIENKLKDLGIGYEEIKYYDNPKHIFLSIDDGDFTIRIYKNWWKITTYNNKFHLMNEEIELIRELQKQYWGLKK